MYLNPPEKKRAIHNAIANTGSQKKKKRKAKSGKLRSRNHRGNFRFVAGRAQLSSTLIEAERSRNVRDSLGRLDPCNTASDPAHSNSAGAWDLIRGAGHSGREGRFHDPFGGVGGGGENAMNPVDRGY
jgi:hypothetical protein